MSTVSEPTSDEAELLRRARAGDDDALESLYTTYVGTARALARRLVGAADAADDLVAEAFARVVAQIRAGRGPTSNFRAYLCTTIRNRHADIAPVLQHEQPASDRPWLLDGTEPALEEALESFDDEEAVAALSSLPHSWRQVLWHLEIEGRRVPEVADLLGTTPAAISSLAYRAREGLKTAYLGQHIAAGSAGGQCGWVRDRLSQFVRGGIGHRAASRIDGHVTSCRSCAGMLARLEHVNGRLAALVVPILLVGVTKGVKAGVVLGGASATSGGVFALFKGPRTLKPMTVAGVGAGVVAAAAVVAVAAVGPPSAGPADRTAAPPAAGSAAEPGGGADASDGPPADRAAPPTASSPTTGPTPDPTPADPTSESGVESVVDPRPSEDPTGQPSPTPDPDPVPVTPTAPTADPITDCGRDGALRLPGTEGVRYDLVTGDGEEGRWVVRASARRGYVIAEDAPTTFRGDLGARYRCPVIRSVRLTDHPGRGNGAPGDRIVVDVDAFGETAQTLQLRIDLERIALVRDIAGDGWSCRTSGRVIANRLTCGYSYTGDTPSRLTIRLVGFQVSGTATLRSDGTKRDDAAF